MKTKISKEQKEEIIILNKKGMKIKEIARIFNVSPSAIRYHLNPQIKEILLLQSRERYKKLSKEEKRERQNKYKYYQKEYHNKKYKEDEDFRNKQIKRSKKYNLVKKCKEDKK